MGRLAGFRHREIVKQLKELGFEFDRQAAGSHEIWFNPDIGRHSNHRAKVMARCGDPTSLIPKSV